MSYDLTCWRCGSMLEAKPGEVLLRCVKCERQWPATADEVAALQAEVKRLKLVARGVESALAAAERRAEEAETSLAAVRYELDDFAPPADEPLAAAVARLRDRLSERVAEIEGREGLRLRLAAAESRAASAEAELVEVTQRYSAEMDLARQYEPRLASAEADRDRLREALEETSRGGAEGIACWCEPWWDDRPASGPPRYIHSDGCVRARAALGESASTVEGTGKLGANEEE